MRPPFLAFYKISAACCTSCAGSARKKWQVPFEHLDIDHRPMRFALCFCSPGATPRGSARKIFATPDVTTWALYASTLSSRSPAPPPPAGALAKFLQHPLSHELWILRYAFPLLTWRRPPRERSRNFCGIRSNMNYMDPSLCLPFAHLAPPPAVALAKFLQPPI